MNQFKKSVLIRILCIAFILSNVFAQNAGLITQKINVENAIRDKVNVTVGKILDQSKFVAFFRPLLIRKALSLSFS